MRNNKIIHQKVKQNNIKEGSFTVVNLKSDWILNSSPAIKNLGRLGHCFSEPEITELSNTLNQSKISANNFY